MLLGVNIDHVATLRQVRGTTYPSLIDSANIAVAAGADSITLHRREELTTEGGLDIVKNKQKVGEACTRMKIAGIRPSLFLDADPKQIEAAAESGASVIEIHTGSYANAYHTQSRSLEFKKIADATVQAISLGLQVNAGHGLNYENVKLIAEIIDVHELNIGHSIIAQAVFDGLEGAVQKMKKIMQQARL